MQHETTNLEKRRLIAKLEKISRKNKEKIWLDIAKRLKKPSRNIVSVNLWQIERLAKNEKTKKKTFLVPGKVLAYGDLESKVNVAAFKFSDVAKEKIDKNGKAMTINELLAKKINPAEIVIIN